MAGRADSKACVSPAPGVGTVRRPGAARTLYLGGCEAPLSHTRAAAEPGRTQPPGIAAQQQQPSSSLACQPADAVEVGAARGHEAAPPAARLLQARQRGRDREEDPSQHEAEQLAPLQSVERQLHLRADQLGRSAQGERLRAQGSGGRGRRAACVHMARSGGGLRHTGCTGACSGRGSRSCQGRRPIPWPTMMPTSCSRVAHHDTVCRCSPEGSRRGAGRAAARPPASQALSRQGRSMLVAS